jgi:dihydrodiol dehydrogenase / D-xylose 1-dehydrogenase (NADP)
MSTTDAKHALRWGFIGCGKISNDFANALKSVDNAVLHACAARSLSSAEEFATTHGMHF